MYQVKKQISSNSNNNKIIDQTIFSFKSFFYNTMNSCTWRVLFVYIMFWFFWLRWFFVSCIGYTHTKRTLVCLGAIYCKCFHAVSQCSKYIEIWFASGLMLMRTFFIRRIFAEYEVSGKVSNITRLLPKLIDKKSWKLQL